MTDRFVWDVGHLEMTTDRKKPKPVKAPRTSTPKTEESKKSFRYVPKDWSEANQLRDSDGKFAGTTGGGGGGGSAGGGVSEGEYVAGRELDVNSLPPEEKYDQKVGDPRLSKVMEMQGFYSPSSMHTEKEMDELIAGGEREILRGVSTREVATTWIDSRGTDRYTGMGVNGNGIYGEALKGNIRLESNAIFESNPKEIRDAFPKAVRESSVQQAKIRVGGVTAEGYSGPNGAILRMSLRKESRVVSQDDLRQEMMSKGITRIDPGTYAVSRGFDAILVPQGYGGDHIVILNRSAVRTQSTPYEVVQ